jgi:hypothetical protein
VTDTRTVRVILARDDAGVLALVTTGLAAGAAALITRYAARWSIEQALVGARNIPGAGEARNRTRRAVERTVPFALLTHTLIITWNARPGGCPAQENNGPLTAPLTAAAAASATPRRPEPADGSLSTSHAHQHNANAARKPTTATGPRRKARPRPNRPVTRHHLPENCTAGGRVTCRMSGPLLPRSSHPWLWGQRGRERIRVKGPGRGRPGC